MSKIIKGSIACSGLSKDYQEGAYCLKVLQDINLSIAPGEQVAIMGRSGSGKSTLLQLLGGLDRPTRGQVFLQGQALQALKADALAQCRNQTLGFIYQAHHLLAEFNALENVAMPLLIAGQSISESKKRALAMLEAVGLGARFSHKPSQLSGGERQRVAIARALVNNPACVLADEPTGNLDEETALQVFELMQQLSRSYQSSLVMVTHDAELAARMDRVLILHNGQLSEE